MKSMTGFGQARFAYGPKTYRVEVRSVNGRYLDLKIRLPWSDGQLEQLATQRLRKQLVRGRVELAVIEESSAAAGSVLKLHRAMARDLALILTELADTLQCDRATAAQLIPPLKELVVAAQDQEDDPTRLPAFQRGIEEGIARLLEMRREEGTALAFFLTEQLSQVEQLVAKVAALATDAPAHQLRRLQERLASLVADQGIDAQRLAQEAALLADRHDITEELDRLQSHLHQLHEMLLQDGEIGRKIEFMLQECHRELNTVTAKADRADLAHLVVEAKASIEKMREQVQNVE